MRKVIAWLFPEKDETGIRLGIYGLFIAIPGGILVFAGFERLGYWIGLTGALMGLAGSVMHFIRHWRKIFHIHK